MKRALALFGLLICAALHAHASADTSSSAQAVTVRPALLKPAFLLWRIGVNRENPALSAETVFPTEAGGRPVWRITHFSVSPDRPGQGGYDYYDVDAATLRPVVSEMKNPGTDYRIDFAARQARLRRTQDGTTSEETVALPAHLYPEGPGHTAFLAALPLREGYAVEYTSLDRWRKDKLSEHTLRVLDEETVRTPAGSFRSYVLEVEAPNGFYAKFWVLADAPHYPLRVEYLKAPKTVVSEVERVVIGE